MNLSIKKSCKALIFALVTIFIVVLFSINASAASTAYEVTKSGGAAVRKSYAEKADQVYKASYGSILWVVSSKVNSSGNTWYKLSDGYWIFSGNVKKHSCSWSETGRSYPTCTNKGKINYKCKCGATKSTTTAAYGHNYSGNVCTRCGVWNTSSLKSKTAINSVKYYVKTNGAAVHSGPYGACATVATLNKGTNIVVTEKVVNASGNTWYKYNGGYIFSDYVVAHGSCAWNSGSVVTKPTCTLTGWKKYTCTICAKTKTSIIAATGHNYSGNVCKTCGGWNSASLKSKSTVNNVKYYVKTNGAAVHSGPYGACATVKTLSKGIDIVVTEKVVNASGNTWYKYSGGYIFSDYVVAHGSCAWNSGSVVTKPTCTLTGWKKYTCTICSKTKTSILATTAHKYSGNVCTSCGTWNTASLKSKTTISNVKYCVVVSGAKVRSGPYEKCSAVTTLSKGTDIVVTQKVVNASGNTWYKYSGGYIYGEYVKKHSSCSWNSGTVTKKATCTSTGTKVQKCTVCAKSKTTTISKLAHSYSKNVCKVCGNWNTSSLKSTTTMNNVKFCVVSSSAKVRSGPYENCKSVKTLKKGTDIIVTQKVVNASGNTWYKCSYGYIYAENVKGHSSCAWNKVTITKQPTCTKTGTKVYTCTTCGKTKTVTTSQKGHKFEKNVCKVCGAWNTSSLKSKTTVKNVKYIVTTDGAKVHSGPYGDCKTVKKYAKGKTFTVTQKVVNASGNTWYKCSEGYIYGNYVKDYALYTAKTTLNIEKATIYVGEIRAVKATVKGPSKTATWKSSDTSVATVDANGNIKGKKVGTCTITVKANGKTDTCKITVKQLSTPSSPVFSTVSQGRKFKITHKAVSGADGYQVAYFEDGVTKTKEYTGTSATISVSKLDFTSYRCSVRAYKMVNGQKVYSKSSKTYTVHVHNSKNEVSVTQYTKYSPADYTYHLRKTTTVFNCLDCSKKITNTVSVKEKHSFACGVCEHCGEKKGSNYVIGKIYPEIGPGPNYSSSEKKNGQNPIYAAAKYTDSYFTGKSTTMNPDLLKLSAVGASASYNTSFAKQFLKECKFGSIENITSSSTASTTAKDKNDNARMTIGYKKISGTNTTVVAVLVNGYTTGAYEWISNFNVGESGLHLGFSKAADKLTAQINAYIKDKSINTSNIKIWITGHSRGSAVTGMVAVKLNQKYGSKNVYAYGFATPNGVPTDMVDDYYDNNIFNIVNPGDFVPYVVPTKWGFTRFGSTTTIDMNTQAKNLYKKMAHETYSGLTTSERTDLINAFNKYSPDRKAYNTTKPTVSYVGGVATQTKAAPKDFGRAIGLTLSKAGLNSEAISLINKCGIQSGSVLWKMAYNGKITTKINEVHTMETYLAQIYTRYP